VYVSAPLMMSLETRREGCYSALPPRASGLSLLVPPSLAPFSSTLAACQA